MLLSALNIIVDCETVFITPATPPFSVKICLGVNNFMASVCTGRDNLLKVGGLLIVATFIHNLSGYFLGYWSGRLLKFRERDCRTIALEVGMQNAGLASGLALAMGKLATAGLAPAIFGPVMNITGSTLASWWHNHLPKDDVKQAPLESLALQAEEKFSSP